MRRTNDAVTMILLGTMAAALLIASGCQQKPARSLGSAKPAVEQGAVIARYAGNTFTEADLKEAVATLNPRARKSLDDVERRKQFVENRILSDLIYRQGETQGFADDADIQRQVRDLERRLVIQKVMQSHQSATVSDQEVRSYYDSHADEFSGDRVKASHILVKEESLAKDILAQLREDPSRFEQLAAEHSIDRSNAKNGGDLGMFGRGRMVKEFETAAFGLTEDGQISDIVKTRFGYHIIKRNGREDGAVKPFDEVKEQIRIRLVNEKRRVQTQEFLEKIKRDAGYQLDEEALAAASIRGGDPGNAD